MKSDDYQDAIITNSQIGWWTGVAIGATTLGLLFTPAAILISLLIGGAGSALLLGLLNDFGSFEDDFWKKGRSRTFKMIENSDGLIDVYTKVGFTWVFVQGAFEDSYKAQDYIASRRKDHLKEIGRFKA